MVSTRFGVAAAFGVALGIACAGGCATGEGERSAPTWAPAEETHPIIAGVKKDLKHPDQPFGLLVRIVAKPGSEGRLQEAFRKSMDVTRRERGCLRYDLNQSASKPTEFVLVERWASLADLRSHIGAPHMQALLDMTHDLTAAPPALEVVLPAAE